MFIYFFSFWPNVKRKWKQNINKRLFPLNIFETLSSSVPIFVIYLLHRVYHHVLFLYPIIQ